MFIYKGNPRRQRQRYVNGKGLLDWIAPIVRGIGAAGKFVIANKGTIANVADVTGKVAKAGAATASAVKQIADVVRSKAAARRVKDVAGGTALEKTLNQKSLEILKGLAD